MVKDALSEPKGKPPVGPNGAEPDSGTPVVEIDGPTGPDPVRYGDWERRGRCIDF